MTSGAGRIRLEAAGERTWTLEVLDAAVGLAVKVLIVMDFGSCRRSHLFAIVKFEGWRGGGASLGFLNPPEYDLFPEFSRI